LKNSLILEQRNQSYESVNGDKILNSIGFETCLKLEYKDFTLLTNYVFNDVKLDKNKNS
jgi:outer membrane receptor for ferrienterochelin and colicins